MGRTRQVSLSHASVFFCYVLSEEKNAVFLSGSTDCQTRIAREAALCAAEVLDCKGHLFQLSLLQLSTARASTCWQF